MAEVDDLLEDVKPWTEHRLYENAFTKPIAIKLAELCERYTDAKLKLGGITTASDRREMLRMTWQHYVGRMHTDNQGTLASDASIFEVLQQVEGDAEKFVSLSEPSKKLKRPLSSDQVSRKELETVDIEEPSSSKRLRQDLTQVSSRPLPAVPVKLPGIGSSGVYYSRACTRML